MSCEPALQPVLGQGASIARPLPQAGGITSFVQGLLCCGCQKSFKIKARRKSLGGVSELDHGHLAADDLHVFA